MQTTSLALQLAETHGVAVCHVATLPPENLCSAFKKYGKVSIVRSFVLTDDTYATVVFFAEPLATAACQESLAQLAQASPALGVSEVGWIHENDVDAFGQRSYVRRSYAIAVPSATANADAIASNGYLVVYWKGVAEAERRAVTQMAQASSLEAYHDDKEGGRSFLRFRTEDDADAFHSQILARFSTMRRYVSYADVADFKLATAAL